MYEVVEACEEEDVREAQEVSSKAQDIQAGDSPYVPRRSSSYPVEMVRRSTRFGAGRGGFREPHIAESPSRKRRRVPATTAATPHCDTFPSPHDSLSAPFPSATASSLQSHNPPEESNDAIGLSHYLQVPAPQKMMTNPSNVANGAPPRRLQTHDPSLRGNPRNVIFASPKYPLTFYVLPCNNPSLPQMITAGGGQLVSLEEAEFLVYPDEPASVVPASSSRHPLSRLVSARWILQCVEASQLLGPQQFLLHDSSTPQSLLDC